MRLIGTFETEQQAYAFYAFLLKENIQNIYEPALEEKTGAKEYRIWIYNEDDLQHAVDWMNLYKQNPNDPKFQSPDLTPGKTPPTPEYKEISREEEQKWQSMPPRKDQVVRQFSTTLTTAILVICAFLFFWNSAQEMQIMKAKGEAVAEIALTPLDQKLFFDVPASYQYIQEMIDTVPLNDVKDLKNLPPDAVALLKKAEEAPSYQGLYPFFKTVKNKGWAAAETIPMFEKIRQGEFWRLFTPCLLHANLLHILFNMIWVWILCKQMELRLKKWKLCLFILIVGIVSNIAQYLVSGPLFLGFSGVVVGMAGFIWIRQVKAPWEGYPLQKSTLLFLLFFVLAMFAIELFTFGVQVFTQVQVTPNIANTAHIVGGLVGIFLGRLPFFARRIS